MYEVANHIAVRSSSPIDLGRHSVVTGSGRDKSATMTREALEELLSAVASRQDRGAFAALFGYFGPRLKSFYGRGGISPEMADELVQEAMLRVWRKATYYDPAQAGVSTWVFTIARNLRTDFRRRQRDPSLLPSDPDDPPPSIEDALVAAERDESLRQALAKLSPEQQAIIRLSYYVDKSQTEIANELGLPLGTVKSRVRLAMNRLRSLLDEAS